MAIPPAERNKGMIAMREGGASLQEIADWFGVSRARVGQILPRAVGQRLPNRRWVLAAKAREDKWAWKHYIEFWFRVDVDGDECWPYTLFRTPAGYGRIRMTRFGHPKDGYAHWAAWLLAGQEETPTGFIPTRGGLNVLHKCDNPACCNPDHLWLGTHQENIADREAKGRGNRPPARAANLVRNRKVLEAVMAGEGQSAVARRLGINKSTVWQIVHPEWRRAYRRRVSR